MNTDSTTGTVTLGDLWSVFKKSFLAVVLTATLAVSAFALAVRLTFVPMYQSTATLYILRQNDEGGTGGAVASDFSLALNVVNDCTYILKMHSVVDAVINDLGLDIPYETLKKRVSTSNPSNTRILEVTVTAESPELAKEIVDGICEVGAEKIKSDMGFAQVNISEYGVINTAPCNKTRMIVYPAIWLLVAAVMYVVLLVRYIMNDGIRSDEDVEKYLGLSVLGDIPNANDTRRHGCYGYGKKTGGTTR